MIKKIMLFGVTCIVMVPASSSFASNSSSATRQTSDYILVKDNGTSIKAIRKTVGTGVAGLSNIRSLDKPISPSKFANTGNTNTRVDCPNPKNPYDPDAEFMFPDKDWAKEWYAYCMSNKLDSDGKVVLNEGEAPYIRIEEDLSKLMEETKTRRAIYQYTKDVPYRKDGEKVMGRINFTTILDKNTPIGSGVKTGFSFIPESDDNTVNLYAVYYNPRASKQLSFISNKDNSYYVDDDMTKHPDWKGYGVIHFFKMYGDTPEDGALEFLDVVEPHNIYKVANSLNDSGFATERYYTTEGSEYVDKDNDPNNKTDENSNIHEHELDQSLQSDFDFKPYGAINVLEYSGIKMSDMEADNMVVDYGYPAKIKDSLPSSCDGTVENHGLESASCDLTKSLRIKFGQRVFEKDQCRTDEEIEYDQSQSVSLDVDVETARFFVDNVLDVVGLDIDKYKKIKKGIISYTVPEEKVNYSNTIMKRYERWMKLYPLDIRPEKKHDITAQLFEKRIIDFLNKGGNKNPSGLLSYGIHSQAVNDSYRCDPENYPSDIDRDNCYDASYVYRRNDIPNSQYGPISKLRDVSVVDFDYYKITNRKKKEDRENLPEKEYVRKSITVGSCAEDDDYCSCSTKTETNEETGEETSTETCKKRIKKTFNSCQASLSYSNSESEYSSKGKIYRKNFDNRIKDADGNNVEDEEHEVSNFCGRDDIECF